MIEEFVPALARSNSPRAPCAGMKPTAADANSNNWSAPGAGAGAALETELLARVIQGEPTLPAEKNAHFDTCSMKPATSPGQDRPERPARGVALKGCCTCCSCPGPGRSLRDVRNRAGRPMSWCLVAGRAAAGAHRPCSCSITKRGRRIRQKRRRVLALLEADPASREIVDFGIAFYQRLLAQTDAALAAAEQTSLVRSR